MTAHCDMLLLICTVEIMLRSNKVTSVCAKQGHAQCKAVSCRWGEGDRGGDTYMLYSVREACFVCLRLYMYVYFSFLYDSILTVRH